MQATIRAPEVDILTLFCAEAAAQKQLQPAPLLWATGQCTGLQLALDTRRPLGQRTSIAGKFRRSVGGGGPEESQLLQAGPLSAYHLSSGWWRAR